jgi:hypothetical protein
MAIAAKYFPRRTEITRDMDLRFDLILTLPDMVAGALDCKQNVRNSEYNFDMANNLRYHGRVKGESAVTIWAAELIAPWE